MRTINIWARKTVTAVFTEEELKILIAASLNDIDTEKACMLLKEKFGGSGYMSGEEIAYQAYEYDKETYKDVAGFADVEW